MEYDIYISKLEEQATNILNTLLEEQKHLNLKYPQDRFNLLIMIANNLLALNGNKDLNFSLIYEILKDKLILDLTLLHFDRILQAATLNKNLILILALSLVKYSNMDNLNSLTEEDKMAEVFTLVNIKSNLNDDEQKFIDDFVIPIIDVFIFASFGKDEIVLLQENLKKLFDNLNLYNTEHNDLIYVSHVIFDILKSKKIIS
jgi:hypothetical protein